MPERGRGGRGCTPHPRLLIGACVSGRGARPKGGRAPAAWPGPGPAAGRARRPPTAPANCELAGGSHRGAARPRTGARGAGLLPGRPRATHHQVHHGNGPPATRAHGVCSALPARPAAPGAAAPRARQPARCGAGRAAGPPLLGPASRAGPGAAPGARASTSRRQASGRRGPPAPGPPRPAAAGRGAGGRPQPRRRAPQELAQGQSARELSRRAAPAAPAARGPARRGVAADSSAASRLRIPKNYGAAGGRPAATIPTFLTPRATLLSFLHPRATGRRCEPLSPTEQMRFTSSVEPQCPRLRRELRPIDELPEVMQFLHARNVRGFVALNTLIFSDQPAAVAEFVKLIAECGGRCRDRPGSRPGPGAFARMAPHSTFTHPRR